MTWRRAAVGRVAVLGVLAIGLTVFAATNASSAPRDPAPRVARVQTGAAFGALHLSFTGPPLGAAAVERRYDVDVRSGRRCGGTLWTIAVRGTGQRVARGAIRAALPPGRALTLLRYRWEVNGRQVGSVAVRIRRIGREVRLQPLVSGAVSGLAVAPVRARISRADC